MDESTRRALQELNGKFKVVKREFDRLSAENRALRTIIQAIANTQDREARKLILNALPDIPTEETLKTATSDSIVRHRLIKDFRDALLRVR